MAWHFNNLSTQLGQQAIWGLSAIINPDQLIEDGNFVYHRPTKHVFFQGLVTPPIEASDGHVHEFWWDGNWHHNDLTIKTGSPGIVILPSSYMFKGQGTKHVIYQGWDVIAPNRRIYELYWDGDWHWKDVTSAALNGPAPFTLGDPFGYEYSFFDTIHRLNVVSQRIVYPAPDHTLHLLYWVPNDGWRHMPLPSLPVPGSDPPLNIALPTAYTFSVQGQAIQGQASQRVLYLSPFGVPDILHVHELTWNEKGPDPIQNWVDNDLSALAGAPPLVGGGSNPVGLMHDLEFTLHVFYVNESGELWELYWNDSGWHANNLTTIMGFSLGIAVGSPLAYVHLQQGTLNVNFRTTSGNIQSVWREVGTPWNSAKQQDLTGSAGAPRAISQPVGFVFEEPQVGAEPRFTQHIYYIANNSPNSKLGDIIELIYEP